MTESPGTLKENEPHPSAKDAMGFVLHYLNYNLNTLETLSSAAMSGNRTAEVCAETLRRVINKEPVSDRYLLGLAWLLASLNVRKKLGLDE